MRFKVSWWIHGAGRIARGFDIIETDKELDEDKAEELIRTDLDNIRESEPSCYTLKFTKFCEIHNEITFESHHSEVSNWKVMRVLALGQKGSEEDQKHDPKKFCRIIEDSPEHFSKMKEGEKETGS